MRNIKTELIALILFALTICILIGAFIDDLVQLFFFILVLLWPCNFILKTLLQNEKEDKI